MSEFNGFDNQNNGSDYSYSWNGSNNNNKKNGGRGIAIILIVIAMAFVISVSAYFASQMTSDLDFSEDAQSTSSSESEDNSSKADSDESEGRPDYSVPEFTPAPDSNVDLSTTLTQIYDHCSPSCCSIYVKTGTGISLGSGFVIDAENGYVATNHHVIDGATEIKVVFYNDDEYVAELIGSDAVTDIAVLKIEAEGLVQLEIGSSDNIKVGENVVAIGTPHDMVLAGTMTCGIVSGIARDIEITNDDGKVIKTMTLIQTDCSINPGNSGGPLIDMAGNVIGITSLKLVDEKFEGIGFAIPITAAVDIFQKLIAGEEIGDSGFASASARIGITAYDLEYGLEYFRLYPRCEYPEGILVGEIEYDSAAYIAGLSVCDIITHFDGTEVKDLDGLSEILSEYKAGDEVTITVFRFTNRTLSDGETLEITFKLGAAK